MTTKYFADPVTGKVKGFSDGATPPDNWMLTDGDIRHGLDTWVNGQWQRYQEVLPLSARLENILEGAGQQLAAEPNPTPELMALVQAIMAIDAQLSKISDRFGGDTPLYRAAAKDALTKLGELPPDLEPARQAMLAECEA